MWPFKKKLEVKKAPHEIFPDILHWELGDEVRHFNGLYNVYYKYKGINSDGCIFLNDESDDIIKKTDIKIAKEMFNKSLNNRTKRKEIEQTAEYMQLMTDFQKAYKEISD